MSSTTLPKTTSENWDKSASSYSSLITPTTSPLSLPLRKMLDLMDNTSAFSTATSILDLGCGPGLGISTLISEYSAQIPATTTALLAGDFSPEMVSQTASLRQTKLSDPSTSDEEKGLWQKLETRVLDATDMSTTTPSSSLSHILSNFVIFLTENPVSALRECHRVLSPGGVLGTSSTASSSWMTHLHSAALRAFPLKTATLPTPPTLPPQWSDVSAAKSQLRDVGFRDVKGVFVETAMLVADLEGWTKRFLESGNPAVGWITEGLGADEMEVLGRRFVDVVREECGRDGEGRWVLPGVAVVVVGVK